MAWLWVVVLFSLASAAGYFRQFWRKVDDRVKRRRRRELLRLERKRRLESLAAQQEAASGEPRVF
jgi:hypothetical protein